MLKKGFLMIPNYFFDIGLNLNMIMILSMIISIPASKHMMATRKFICSHLRICEKTFYTAIKKLVAKGLVSKIRVSNSKFSAYVATSLDSSKIIEYANRSLKN